MLRIKSFANAMYASQKCQAESGCKKKKSETRGLQLFSRLIKTGSRRPWSERLLHRFFLPPLHRVHVLPVYYFRFQATRSVHLSTIAWFPGFT